MSTTTTTTETPTPVETPQIPQTEDTKDLILNENEIDAQFHFLIPFLRKVNRCLGLDQPQCKIDELQNCVHKLKKCLGIRKSHGGSHHGPETPSPPTLEEGQEFTFETQNGGKRRKSCKIDDILDCLDKIKDCLGISRRGDCLIKQIKDKLDECCAEQKVCCAEQKACCDEQKVCCAEQKQQHTEQKQHHEEILNKIHNLSCQVKKCCCDLEKDHQKICNQLGNLQLVVWAFIILFILIILIVIIAAFWRKSMSKGGY